MCRSKSVCGPSAGAALFGSSTPMASCGDASGLARQTQKSEFSGFSKLEYAKSKENYANPVAFALLGDFTKLKDLDKWTADEIASWLLAVGLVNCAAKVKSHDIAGDVAGDVTFEDAAEMGLKEIDCYRLVRALNELQILVDEVWRRPNQLSDRLKQDSLEHHRLKWNQTNSESEVLRESNPCKQVSHEYHRASRKTEAHFVDCLKQDSLDNHHLKRNPTNIKSEVLRASNRCKQDSHEHDQANRNTEANCTDKTVTQAPRSPQTQLILPIKKRVRFNDEVEHVAI